jgi:GNAT superfamily N-acetyltransferase
MSIIEAEIEPHHLPLAIRVRLAGPRDIDDLCDLLGDGETAREQVLTWLAVAVLMTRLVPLEGMGAHKVIEVDNLVVRADQRGRRIGRRLLAAAVEWSRQRRAVQVEAVVGEGAARRFYENFGFAVANDRLVLAA